MRGLAQRKFARTPLDWPLIIFFGVTLISTLIAVSNKSLEGVEARRWIRIIAYYLTFFMVTNMIRNQRQLDFLLNGIFLMATIVAVVMIVQFLLGSSVQILPGRVESLWTQGTTFEDVTRVLPPGISIVIVSFISLVCILVLTKSKPVKLLQFIQCSLLGTAFLLTFLRSYWAAIIMVFFLMMLLIKRKYRLRIIKWALIALYLLTIILLVVFINPDSRMAKLISASMDRLSTLAKLETFQGQDSSLSWRLLENDYAFSTIASHPWLGIGMSARYRPFEPLLDSDTSGYDFRRHIHNGYLWILMDTGLIGFLAFMWLSITFVRRGLRNWRSIANDRMRGIALGFTLVYIAVLIAAIANSTFTQWSWTPVIGIIMGVNEVIFKENGNG